MEASGFMAPTVHPLCKFVRQTYQAAWKGNSKDKWENVRDFMSVHPTVLDELKYNGTRAFFISGEDGKQALATKHNGVYTKADYPPLFEDLANVQPRTILDGEVVKGGPHEATYPYYYIFDVLKLAGRELIYTPLKARKLLLHELQLSDGRARLVESPVCNTEQQVREQFDAASHLGFEGIVLKDPEAPYNMGRSWLKVRDTDTIDAFVISNDPPDPNGIIWTYTVGLYDRFHGELGYAWTGRVSSALADVDRSEIKIGSVLEVRFNTFEGKIVFPGTIVRIRYDKIPTECTTEQL